MTQKENKRLYYRLIALWILIESLLGGIFHGLKIPVTGILVGGAAMICIILIAKYFPQKGSVFKAMVLVAIFKLMLSPHSPPTAYVAVFFQGILGEFLLRNSRFYLFNCLLFGLITMLESAFQRIVVLVILYGMEFWKAVDQWFAKLTGDDSFNDFSLYLAAGYVTLHAIIGLGIAFLGWKISNWKTDQNSENRELTITTNNQLLSTISNEKPQKGWFRFSYIIALLAFGLFVQSLVQPESALLPKGKIPELMLRFVLIISIWKLLVDPFIEKILQVWLKKKSGPLKESLEEIRLILPQMRWLVQESWRLSGKKITGIGLFLKILFYNLLQNNET